MSQDSHEHPEQYVPRPYRGYDPDEHGWEQDARDEEKQAEKRRKAAAYRRAWRAANPDKQKAIEQRSKESRGVAAYRAAYRAANRAQLNAYQREYYRQHKEEICAKHKDRYAAVMGKPTKGGRG